MVKVAFVTDGIFPHAVGGMQRHSRLLLEKLAAYPDLEIHVFHPHEEQVFDERLGLIETHITGIREDKNYLRETYKYSQRVADKLIELNPDVIYSQGLAVWSKSKRFKDKLIVNPHGLEPYQALSYKDKIIAIPFKRVFKKIFKNSRHVVSLGGGLTNILTQVVERDKIVVLPNAALPAPAARLNFEEVPLNFLFVARFAHNKGIHILMEAILQLNDRGLTEKAAFHFAGKGPLFDRYVDANEETNVHLHGFVSDDELAELYNNAHCFIFPTLFEGMPTVVLESMSRGLPIIVSDVGATAELVDDSNGYLIEKANVDAVVHAVEDFIALRIEEKKKLSQASKRKFEEQFTWEKVAEEHYKLFKAYTK